MANVRDAYWDSLKLNLVFLVVLGHFLELHLHQHSDGRVLFNMIYLFHMPLFVFISGRFSVVRDRERYLRGIWRLLKFFLLCHGLQFLILWVTGLERNPWHFISTTFATWYLLSLVWWRLMVLYLPARWLSDHRRLLLTIATGFAMVVGLIPLSKHLAFQVTFAYLPFFLLGYYSKDVDMRRLLSRIPWWAAAAVLAVALVAVAVWFNKPLHDLYFNTTYWDSGWWHMKERLVTRPILMVIATVLGLCVMRLSPSAEWMARYGRNMLYIYLIHIFVRLALIKLINLHYISDSLPALVLYSVVVTAVLAWLSCRYDNRLIRQR